MNIIDRNALACETAQQERCVCACGGAFHGIRHPNEWLAQAYVEAYVYDRIIANKGLDYDFDALERQADWINCL
jgi:hypothetical protein